MQGSLFLIIPSTLSMDAKRPDLHDYLYLPIDILSKSCTPQPWNYIWHWPPSILWKSTAVVNGRLPKVGQDTHPRQNSSSHPSLLRQIMSLEGMISSRKISWNLETYQVCSWCSGKHLEELSDAWYCHLLVPFPIIIQAQSIAAHGEFMVLIYQRMYELVAPRHLVPIFCILN